MFNHMGGKLLFGVLSGLLVILSSASADNLVTNGDFSSGYLANVSLCNFNGGFFGLGASCIQAIGTTNFLSPSNWTFNSLAPTQTFAQTAVNTNGSIFGCGTAGAGNCNGLAFNANMTNVSMNFTGSYNFTFVLNSTQAVDQWVYSTDWHVQARDLVGNVYPVIDFIVQNSTSGIPCNGGGCNSGFEFHGQTDEKVTNFTIQYPYESTFNGGNHIGIINVSLDVNDLSGRHLHYIYDSVHISSKTNCFGTGDRAVDCGYGTNIVHLNMYTISQGGEYSNRVCGYSAPLTCSTISAGGNTSFNPNLQQNVTLPNNSYVLTFDYWTPYIPTRQVGVNSVQFSQDIAYSPDGRFYNCANPFDMPAGSTACKLSSFFQVQLIKSDGTVIINTPLSANADGTIKHYLADLSTSPTVAAGTYILKFFTTGTGANDSANGIDLANIQLSAKSSVGDLGIQSNYINDVNTLTGIGYNFSSAVGGGVGGLASTRIVQVSRNFSDFYKFYIQVNSSTGSHSCNGDGNWIAMNSTGSISIVPNNVNIKCNASDNLISWTGYVPANITTLLVDQSMDGGGGSLKVNITFNEITIINRCGVCPNGHGWKLPITDEIYQSFPFVYYGFRYDSSSQLVNFTVYNFRNTSSYGAQSLNRAEGTNSSNIFLYDSDKNLLATSTDSRTYFQEYTPDFSSIIKDNGGMVGNIILINRTANNAFYDSIFTVPTSQFAVNIPQAGACSSNVCIGYGVRQFSNTNNAGVCEPYNQSDSTCLSAASQGPPSNTQINSAFNSLFTLGGTSNWSIGLKLLIWTSISFIVTFGIVWKGSTRITQLGDFRNIGILFIIMFMLGTFLPPGETPFVPIWFWGFIVLGVVFMFTKNRIFGEKE